MYKRLIFSVLLMLVCTHATVVALEPAASRTTVVAAIPTSLEEAHQILEERLRTTDIAELKKGGTAVLDAYYWDLERWIKNTWLTQSGSPIVAYFKHYAITDHDRMVKIIINSFHHYLNGRTIQIGAQE